MGTLKVILLLLLCKIGITNRYCETVCGSAHILCFREPCGKGGACGTEFKVLPLSDRERLHIAYYHNKLRQELAFSGSLIFSTDAANMCAISYSKELEFISQCTANSCYTETYEDLCRNTHTYQSVAESYFYDRTREIMLYESLAIIEKIVDEWYSKRHELTIGLIDSYYATGRRDMAHFMNLAWAKTRYVGCARSLSSTAGYLVVCSYAPSRMKKVGQAVFKRGNACSLCDYCFPGAKCNRYYQGLCGKIRELSDDTFEPPFQMAGVFYTTHSKILIYILAIYFVII